MVRHMRRSESELRAVGLSAMGYLCKWLSRRCLRLFSESLLYGLLQRVDLDCRPYRQRCNAKRAGKFCPNLPMSCRNSESVSLSAETLS